MVLKSASVAAGACALVAGAAIAGSAAHATAPATAPVAAQPQAAVPDADLAGLLAADTSTPADEATPAGAGAAMPGQAHRTLCARVPTAILHTQNFEKLLAADASTKGSLAYLQRRIDAAEAAHRTALTAELKNRLIYRKQLAAFLPQRLTLLQTARTTICAPPAGSPATS